MDQDRVVFYVINYIDWDQFNKLYDTDWFNKGIWNADTMARKLRPALIKATNLRLEVAKEEVRRKQEVVKRRKAEAVAAKQQRIEEILIHLMKMIIIITVTRILRIQTKRTISIQFKEEMVVGELEMIRIEPRGDT